MDKVNVRLIGNQVLIVPQKENKRVGGILLHDASKRIPFMGLVAAIGPGLEKTSKTFPMADIEIGDLVIYNAKMAEPVQFPNNEIGYIITKIEHISAVIDV